MAEWRTVTRRKGAMTTTFQVIGYPFAFMRASLVGDPDEYLRCFPDVEDEKQDDVRYAHHLSPENVEELYYDLMLKKAGDDDEVDEDGWYLSGVGHHLLWCAADLMEAVDVAQEQIAWDGSDPTSLRMTPPKMHDEKNISHRLPYDQHVWQTDPLLRKWCSLEGEK